MLKTKKIILLLLILYFMTILLYAKKKEGLVTVEKGSLYNDGKNNYATSKARFSIISKDKLSDVKFIMFKIDKGGFTEYKKSITFSGEGPHTIYYYSIDNVENKSKENSYSVIIDNTAPEVKLIPSVKLNNIGNKQFAPGSAEFILKAEDKGCGVKIIEHSIDGKDYVPYIKSIKFNKKELHTIKYRAKDNLGNLSKEETFSLYIDNVKPVVKIILSGKLFERDNKKYVPADYKYSIETDRESESTDSGVSEILVAIDGKEFKLYTSPFTLSGEGEHRIKAKAIDNVGNVSEEVELVVILDATPPDVKLLPKKK